MIGCTDGLMSEKGSELSMRRFYPSSGMKLSQINGTRIGGFVRVASVQSACGSLHLYTVQYEPNLVLVVLHVYRRKLGT